MKILLKLFRPAGVFFVYLIKLILTKELLKILIIEIVEYLVIKSKNQFDDKFLDDIKNAINKL